MQQSFTSRERAGLGEERQRDGRRDALSAEPPPGSLRLDLNVYFFPSSFFFFFLIVWKNKDFGPGLVFVLQGCCWGGGMDGWMDGGRSRRLEAPRRPGRVAETSPCNLEGGKTGGKGKNRKDI